MVLQTVILEHKLVLAPRLEDAPLLHLQVPLPPRQDLHRCPVPRPLHEARHKVNGVEGPVFLAEEVPHLLGPPHELLVRKGTGDRGGEAVWRELLHRDRGVCDAELLEVVAPKPLLAHKRAAHARDPELHRGPSVKGRRRVDGKGTAREQVRDGYVPIHQGDVGGKLLRHETPLGARPSDDPAHPLLVLHPGHPKRHPPEPLPLALQDHPHARQPRRLHRNRRQALRVRAPHRSEAHKDGGWPAGDKLF
mmetsp:Transcript_30610/g.77085  ORF Transcript_30610/g.77085 Transcript_30610/m.77085 type:complete len:249 (+) Transcript_30610:377-1123(+)